MLFEVKGRKGLSLLGVSGFVGPSALEVERTSEKTELGVRAGGSEGRIGSFPEFAAQGRFEGLEAI